MIVAVFLLTLFYQPPDYDALVNALTATRSDAEEAQTALIKAGVDAFPVLLRHLNDSRPVEIPHYEIRISRTTNELVTNMKLGELVFDIIRNQIEGPAHPKSAKSTYLLTKKNIERWVEDRKGMTLEQLRFMAVSDSIQSLSTEMSKVGVNASNVELMQFHAGRLSKMALAASKNIQ